MNLLKTNQQPIASSIQNYSMPKPFLQNKKFVNSRRILHWIMLFSFFIVICSISLGNTIRIPLRINARGYIIKNFEQTVHHRGYTYYLKGTSNLFLSVNLNTQLNENASIFINMPQVGMAARQIMLNRLKIRSISNTSFEIILPEDIKLQLDQKSNQSFIPIEVIQPVTIFHYIFSN